MNSETGNEMYKPQVGYEMCGDKVSLVIPQSDHYNERRLVMTKDLFIACYEHWIKKVEHDRQPEEKTGKWIIEHFITSDLVYCSECGFGKSIEEHRPYNFCPNCGARMTE